MVVHEYKANVYVSVSIGYVSKTYQMIFTVYYR